MSSVLSRPVRRAVVRARAVLARAWRAQRRRDANRTLRARLATAGVCVVAGLMVAAGALNARGIDLRPGRNTDLVGLVQAQSRRNAELSRTVTTLRQQVDALAATQDTDPAVTAELESRGLAAGFRPVRGPALAVTLDDAPASVAADGVDPDLLVVHQQDIQAVVNALWAGGAEAMTIQGNRVISTTGVKCVGNTVVLHGTPYAPPYVISAIGDPNRLAAALSASKPIQIYKQYVEAFALVYEQRMLARAEFPAYEGPIELRHASAGLSGPSKSGTPR